MSLIQDPWNPTHIQDMLLLQNFVLSNSLYREQGGSEFNAPICMPHVHQTAFLHAYIYYLEPGNTSFRGSSNDNDFRAAGFRVLKQSLLLLQLIQELL